MRRFGWGFFLFIVMLLLTVTSAGTVIAIVEACSYGMFGWCR